MPKKSFLPTQVFETPVKITDIPALEPQQAISQAARLRTLFKLDQMIDDIGGVGRVNLEELLDIMLVRQTRFTPDRQMIGQPRSVGILGIVLNQKDRFDLFAAFNPALDSYTLSIHLHSMTNGEKNLALAIGIGIVALGMIDSFSRQGILIEDIRSVFDENKYKPLLLFVVHLLLPPGQLENYINQDGDPDLQAARIMIARHYQLPVQLVEFALQHYQFAAQKK